MAEKQLEKVSYNVFERDGAYFMDLFAEDATGRRFLREVPITQERYEMFDRYVFNPSKCVPAEIFDFVIEHVYPEDFEEGVRHVSPSKTE